MLSGFTRAEARTILKTPYAALKRRSTTVDADIGEFFRSLFRARVTFNCDFNHFSHNGTLRD